MVKRLGKGLDAIIASHQDDTRSGVAAVPIDQIRTNPHQPRQMFDPEALEELADSIRQKGIITPVTLREDDDGYILIAGERRLRAAQIAGLTEIPAYVIEISDDVDIMEVALIENIQRENLNPIEEAEAYSVLHSKHDLSQEQIAKAVGKKRVTVTNALRLLKLPTEIKRSLREDEITAGHGRALLGLKTTNAQLNLWQKIVREGLSVRVTEALVQQANQSETAKKSTAKKRQVAPQVKAIEDEMISLLGTKVKLKPGKDGGSITINYYSNDDLERLLDLLRKIEE